MFILVNRIKGVILDSPFIKFEEFMWRIVPKLSKNGFNRRLLKNQFKDHLGVDLFDNDPIKKIVSINIPSLFIYRTHDQYIQQQEIMELIQKSQSSVKKLHLLENLDHFQEPYEDDFIVVKNFLNKIEINYFVNLEENIPNNTQFSEPI